MPQPLSKVAPQAKRVSLGGIRAPHLNGNVHVLLASTMISFASLEIMVAGLLVKVVPFDPRSQVAMLYSLQSGSAQRAALTAALKVYLSASEMELLDKVLAAYRAVAKKRNKLAHWLYGTCSELSAEQFLLCNPVELVLLKAKGKHGLLMGEQSHQDRMDYYLTMPDHEKIFVYHQDELDILGFEMLDVETCIIMLSEIIDLSRQKQISVDIEKLHRRLIEELHTRPCSTRRSKELRSGP